MGIPVVRWVGQEDINGCGVACLAMVTGKTYADVAAEVPARSFHNDGVHDSFMDALLAGWGFAVARRFVGTGADAWTPEPFADVHLCVVGHGAENDHCVVMISDGTVLDPNRAGKWKLSDYPYVVSVAAVVPINRREVW